MTRLNRNNELYRAVEVGAATARTSAAALEVLIVTVAGLSSAPTPADGYRRPAAEPAGGTGRKETS